jgi:hypothetical protein
VQETGRDQAHTQLGIALLSDCAEIAWHQGLDLYGYADNRLLKGFEYTAKYNLGNNVPFTHVLDRTGKYEHFKPSEMSRGALRAVYEQVYNHYVNRKGMAAPFTEQAAAKIRPEGPGRPGADHPGYGTLFYSRPSQPSYKPALTTVPVAPGAIVASGSSTQNILKWVASIGANDYTVKRSVKKGGPYTVIAKNVTGTSYTDKQIKSGTVYYYTVSASNVKGESSNAYEAGITAGLPAPWLQQDIGNVTVAGTIGFDGQTFRIEASGMGTDSINDTFHFVYVPLNDDGTITARLAPEPGSQFSRMGLMMRESTENGAPFVSLLVYPGRTGQVEAPSWHARLLSRKSTGQVTMIDTLSAPLTDAAVTYGRLTGAYWIRLQRKNNQFTAFGSYNGKDWLVIGAVTVPLKKKLLMGIPVCSGMPNSTIVQFGNVIISK